MLPKYPCSEHSSEQDLFGIFCLTLVVLFILISGVVQLCWSYRRTSLTLKYKITLCSAPRTTFCLC